MLISKLVSQADIETEWFKTGCRKMRELPRYYRKLWEWCYIYQGLLERGLLAPDKEGLGFGVGKEPLTALFASHGCMITATDLEYEQAAASGWVTTNQHCGRLADLNERGICDAADFTKLVRFENLDMNFIDDKYSNRFDFTWSACAFDHCGSIELGKKFILNQMKCLKPGGVAIHTTEYNVSSEDETQDNDPVVLYRKMDIVWMVQTLRNAGHAIDLDLTVGDGIIESYVDTYPYTLDPQLRLQVGRYVSTSIGLIIRKGP
jgi:SAM-dependent methyltransferase